MALSFNLRRSGPPLGRPGPHPWAARAERRPPGPKVRQARGEAANSSSFTRWSSSRTTRASDATSRPSGGPAVHPHSLSAPWTWSARGAAVEHPHWQAMEITSLGRLTDPAHPMVDLPPGCQVKPNPGITEHLGLRLACGSDRSPGPRRARPGATRPGARNPSRAACLRRR